MNFVPILTYVSLLGLVFIRLPKFKWPEYKYLKIFISCNLWPWDICSIWPLSDFPEWFYDVTDPDTSHLIFEYDSRDIKRHLIVFKYAVWLYLIADSPKTDNSFLTRASLRTRGHALLRVIPKSHDFWPSREVITGKNEFFVFVVTTSLRFTGFCGFFEKLGNLPFRIPQSFQNFVRIPFFQLRISWLFWIISPSMPKSKWLCHS